MSQNGNAVATQEPVVDANAANAKDESHLIVQLTQESYDAIKDVVDRATARGLDSTFDHWLNDAVKTGTRARTRTWDDRDYVTLFKQCASTNAIIANAAKQKLAKLLKMDVSQ
jgi:hypothetical protein